MRQEDKELLLKDLCARLPYGVIVQYDDYFDKDYPRKPKILTFTFLEACSKEMDKWNPKPYLRPMSSMTEEEKTRESWLKEYGSPDDYVDFCLSHHLDYRTSNGGFSMIEKGLALEAPENMYGNKQV